MNSENDKNVIPPITDPLGRSWDRSEILIDDTHAVMTCRTFNALAEYSGSMPSGVYEGKMWKRFDGLFDYAARARGRKPEWNLVWFSRYSCGCIEAGKQLHVDNNFRLILLADGDLPEVEGNSNRVPKAVPSSAKSVQSADKALSEVSR